MPKQHIIHSSYTRIYAFIKYHTLKNANPHPRTSKSVNRIICIFTKNINIVRIHSNEAEITQSKQMLFVFRDLHSIISTAALHKRVCDRPSGQSIVSIGRLNMMGTGNTCIQYFLYIYIYILVVLHRRPHRESTFAPRASHHCHRTRVRRLI